MHVSRLLSASLEMLRTALGGGHPLGTDEDV